MQMARLRTAYITPVFAPELDGPPVWIAESLRHNGISTAVLTAIPNYPLGQVYPGYSAWRAVRETTRGFPVLRTPLYPSHDASALRRLATYGTFAVSASATGHAMLKSADVTLVYATQLTAALPAMTTRRLDGTPYVLIVQDIWPDTIFATGFIKQGLLRWMTASTLSAFAQRAYALASHIVVIAPGMRDALISRGVPSDKVSLVYNWADESTMRPLPANGLLRQRLGLSEDDTVLMYAGNHGRAQALSSWLDAMNRLSSSPNVHLVMVGQGPEKQRLQAEVARRALRNVHMFDAVPSDQISLLAADADAMIISLADHPLFDITLPGKTQANLALGKAILASGRGDLGRVVADSGAGWLAAPEDPPAIECMIRSALHEGRGRLSERGRAGLDYYQKHMSQAIGGAKLAAILQQAADGDRRRARHCGQAGR